MQNKEKEKEEMLEKTLQEKEDLIKSLNEKYVLFLSLKCVYINTGQKELNVWILNY